MGMTSVATPTGDCPLYASEPDGPGPWPGVVVVHDIYGMTNDLRAQADWLAREGYLAAAPDLFHGRRATARIFSMMREARARQGSAFDDIDATTAWLRARDNCQGTVGVIGYSMGGGFALLLATGHGFKASSVNYGAASKTAYSAEALRGSCPIVGSYGGRDRSLKGAAERLQTALAAAGVDHDVKEYPDAGHGFLNDHVGAGDKGSPLFSAMGWVTHMGYHEACAEDARRRIVAFFDRYLKGAAA
jgi:carboxymethylenebutenolidase